MSRLSRAQLSAVVRLLAGIGMLAVMIVFLRACLSPPQLPVPPPPASADPDATINHGSLPPRY